MDFRRFESHSPTDGIRDMCNVKGDTQSQGKKMALVSSLARLETFQCSRPWGHFWDVSRPDLPKETDIGPGDKPEGYQQSSIPLSSHHSLSTSTLGENKNKKKEKRRRKKKLSWHTHLKIGGHSLPSPNWCPTLHGHRDACPRSWAFLLNLSLRQLTLPVCATQSPRGWETAWPSAHTSYTLKG